VDRVDEGAHCALNCCSTTVLAPSMSVAVTRRVTLPLTCRSEIWVAKEPALVRVRVVWRRDLPRPLRMSSVIVAGSDTVRWSVSRRPLARSVRLTMAGRSSIETVGGVFVTTRFVVVVELVVVEVVVVVVGRVVVVLLVVDVVGTVVVVELVVVVVGARVVVVEDDVDVVVDEVVVELVLVVVGRVVLVVVVDGLVVLVDVVVVDVLVDAVSVSAAATASRRPKPVASSKPGAPTSTAPPVSAAFTPAGVSVGSRSRSSAATPAECGAAADVPKNAQKGGHSGNPPAFEIATPSNATRSGLARSSGVGKSMRAGPCELNGSTVSRPGSWTSTAPTATTDDNAACPKMLPAAEPCSIADAPRQKSSRRRGAPATRLTRTLASWSVLVWFTTWTISIGSCAPTWRSVLAAMRFRLASKRARS